MTGKKTNHTIFFNAYTNVESLCQPAFWRCLSKMVFIIEHHLYGYKKLYKIHSVRKLFTGLATAALIAWKLIVIIVISKASNALHTKTPAPMLMR